MTPRGIAYRRLQVAAQPWVDWARKAACLGLETDLFYSTSPTRIARAKGVCDRCFVQADCLRTADRLERGLGVMMVHGIWGGETPRERIQRRGVMRIEATRGTRKADRLHA